MVAVVAAAVDDPQDRSSYSERKVEEVQAVVDVNVPKADFLILQMVLLEFVHGPVVPSTVTAQIWLDAHRVVSLRVYYLETPVDRSGRNFALDP